MASAWCCFVGGRFKWVTPNGVPHLIKPLIDVKFDKIMQKECAKTYSSFLKIV